MAKQVIEVLKATGVEYIVAPYEADAQMAYLATTGEVHAVVTEDSDMLAYGCQRVLFKMDKMGEGQQILLSDLALNKPVSFVGFTQQMFLEMCIMAGCDFLKTPNGIGVKRAHQQIRRVKNFVRACKSLRLNGTSIPRTFEAEFQRVIWVFHYQRVFCKRRQGIVHINPLPEGGLLAGNVLVPDALPNGDSGQELDFLGPHIEAEVAQAVAVGDLDPVTLQPFDLSQSAAENQSIDGTQANGREQSATQPSSGRAASGSKRRSGTNRALPVGASGIANYFSAVPASCKQAKRQFVAPRFAATPHQPVREIQKPGTSQRCSAADEETTESHCLSLITQKETTDGHALGFSRFAFYGDCASGEGSTVPAWHGRRRGTGRPPIPGSTPKPMDADRPLNSELQSTSEVSQATPVGDNGSNHGTDLGMGDYTNGGEHWLTHGCSLVGDSLCSASPVLPFQDCNDASPGGFPAGLSSPMGSGNPLHRVHNSGVVGSTIRGLSDDGLHPGDTWTPRQAKYFAGSDASPDILFDELFPTPGSIHCYQVGFPSTRGPSSRKKQRYAECDGHKGDDGFGGISCASFAAPSCKRLDRLLDGLVSPGRPLSPLACNAEAPLHHTRQARAPDFSRFAFTKCPTGLERQIGSNSGEPTPFNLENSADQDCEGPLPQDTKSGCSDEPLEDCSGAGADPRKQDGGDPAFYSINHVGGYARMARRALDQLELGRLQKNLAAGASACVQEQCDTGSCAMRASRIRNNVHTGRKAKLDGRYGAAVRSNSARNRLFERFACRP
eukprot:evm.model.scf_115EXC.4 EVM.evm.TU.scf_115EXC.4   scf_115EXC:28666-34216(-)